MSSSDPANQIRAHLEERKYSKWGFVIYRCTYESDDHWLRLIQNLNLRAREDLESHNGLDLLDSLEFTVRDDREAFDGATIEKCRDHFIAWVGSADGRNSEQPNALPLPGSGWDGTPRYTFFLHVDKDALESVVRRAPQPPAIDMDGTRYINIMNSKWEFQPSREQEIDLDGNVIDYDEGEDYDWQRVGLWGLVPWIYTALIGDDLWFTEFGKPPHVWVAS